MQISQNVDGFRQTAHKAFRIHKTLKTKPIREILYFHYLPKLYFG